MTKTFVWFSFILLVIVGLFSLGYLLTPNPSKEKVDVQEMPLRVYGPCRQIDLPQGVVIDRTGSLITTPLAQLWQQI